MILTLFIVGGLAVADCCLDVRNRVTYTVLNTVFSIVASSFGSFNPSDFRVLRGDADFVSYGARGGSDFTPAATSNASTPVANPLNFNVSTSQQQLHSYCAAYTSTD